MRYAMVSLETLNVRVVFMLAGNNQGCKVNQTSSFYAHGSSMRHVECHRLLLTNDNPIPVVGRVLQHHQGVRVGTS